jgi:glycopeptide antibiotics resistance protein
LCCTHKALGTIKQSESICVFDLTLVLQVNLTINHLGGELGLFCFDLFAKRSFSNKVIYNRIVVGFVEGYFLALGWDGCCALGKGVLEVWFA